MNQNKKQIITIVVLIIVFLSAIIIDLCIGSASAVSPDIIFDLRLPHVLCAIIAGAGLAIVGCILQSSLANPLASASTVGISQGASAGACIAIVFIGSNFAQIAFGTVIIFSFIFSLIPTILIYILAKFKNLSNTTIILCGVAMSIFFSGLVAIVQYFADSTQLADVVFWTFGSLRNVNYIGLVVMGVALILSLLYCIFNAQNFNAFASGDDLAHSVGINVAKKRVTNLIVAAACAGIITACCGTINFIGLIAPHLIRRLVSANYIILIPVSALCGATLLLIADCISALLVPGLILPIGAITSLVGAPIFIFALLRENN